MATFASLIQSGNTMDLPRAVTELQSKLPGRRFQTSTLTIANMSSATEATRLSLALSGIEDDELILITAGMLLSGTSAEAGYGILYANGVVADANSFGTAQFSATSSVGNNNSIFTSAIVQNLSGSFNIDLKWARFLGSNTIYSLGAHIEALVLKKRS